ncbi:MutS family DNA mismatch repair protein [Croceitalea sp. MTPC5]|uniref:MutS-related protein n=1 Tax=Croceitalea sp. MTPC5 TaxID=3056565 RepID=UPI002B3784B5|nr:MutS family DNA mismatch repair protein [Croceitalea sp. MTPC5]
MTIDPKAFYNSQILKFQQELEGLKVKLNTSSTLRLLLIALLAATVYFLWENTQQLLVVSLVIIVLFVFLVVRHNGLKYQKDILKALILQNDVELRVLQRNFHGLPDGNSYKDPAHPFSQDIDLFGKGSFYQYMNRTSLKSGADTLARLLLSNDIKTIGEKQAAINELSEMPEWRQKFGAVASLVKTEVSAESVVQWLKGYKSFLPKKVRLLSVLFSSISILSWVFYFLDLLSGYVVFMVFLVGLGITGRYLKNVGRLAAHTTQAQSTFRQYAKLISLLETQDFTSVLLRNQRGATIGDSMKGSKILKQFSKLLDALDQRNNIVIGIVANGFLLRDLFVCKAIEQWIETYRDSVPRWFDAIAFFDAYNSLGNYAFNHPDHTYPKITTSENTLICKSARHPLLNPKNAVANDFTIGTSEFFVITGANMAGKSTFLRTIGLQLLMANVGLPICADTASYTPIKLITSMRTTDSLTDDESYFFSELKRLKLIIETIEKEPHFIILDEILKGTNSTDKATGSKKFIEKLVGLNTSGLIATHDLSLCEVANSLNAVKNYYFDAQIVNNELFFDYTFKEGVCQNMNASFLLHKMGIVE